MNWKNSIFVMGLTLILGACQKAPSTAEQTIESAPAISTQEVQTNEPAQAENVPVQNTQE